MSIVNVTLILIHFQFQ